MLRIDFNLVLTMINLVILFLILRKFLFRPIMNIMEKREAMISDGLKNAEDSQNQALELKSQYEEKLKGAGLDRLYKFSVTVIYHHDHIRLDAFYKGD